MLPLILAALLAPASAAPAEPGGAPDLRIAAVSERFLGTPYRLGPLGEGPDGRFDRDPLIDLQAVDCQTFVEQVMALSLAATTEEALDVLRRIRYKEGVISYRTRNHFTEADWLPNNVAAGFLQDITREVAGDKTARVSKRVSKRAWYAAKTEADLSGLDSLSPEERRRRLEELRALGRDMPDETVPLDYLPLADLPALAGRIPSGAIVCVVRADRPDKPTVVSHMGLLIRKGGVLFLRHAASGKAVEDVPALEYFRRFAGASWPALGINLSRPATP